MSLAAAFLSQMKAFPVLGENFTPSDYCLLDLSIRNPDFKTTDVNTYKGLDAYVQSVLQQNHAQIGYGGYGEYRIFYEQSPLFNDGSKPPRCIHLGLDLWSPAGTAVYAPLEAQVHSFRYNNQMLDYGATIILEHIIESLTFYTLYGHLSLASLENLYPGKPIAKGEKFAAFGNRQENGGWVPHLHFQVILDMEGREGDFPGVATQAEAAYFLKRCPNPSLFLPFLPQKV
ncbi:MAG: peptidoglycan DD-metalloendopeptidase family protein [Saprospiraceae bacterium]|nr:peptidoglycan DD-metalloendopeptidase family protein [Saprospiraceae bacterium]